MLRHQHFAQESGRGTYTASGKQCVNLVERAHASEPGSVFANIQLCSDLGERASLEIAHEQGVSIVTGEFTQNIVEQWTRPLPVDFIPPRRYIIHGMGLVF